MSPASGPLTFGQTSMWRGIEDLPRSRWAELNLADVWPLPEPIEYGRVRDALAVMASRHPTLRTTYDFDDPETPRQCLHPVGGLRVEMVESPAEDLRKFVSALAATPISLHQEYGWSAYVITRRRTATHFAMVFHHMTADGIGIKIFWDELVSLLQNGGEPATAESPYDLIQLAIDQRQTPARQARQAAAARHWHATLAAASRALPSAADDSGPDAPVLLVRLHSRRSRAAASELASQTRTTVAAVLLAAYARAIAEVQGVRSIPMRVLSSNRYEKRWEQCVTSLNQWAPLHIDVGTESFGELAVRSHTASLLAYLHGMFDPDAIASVCAQYPARVAEIEHVWAVNYIPTTTTPSPDPGMGQAEVDGQLTWEPALRNLGPRFYLRAIDGEDGTWTLQLRTRGVDRRQAGALIERVHHTLIGEAARLDIS